MGYEHWKEIEVTTKWTSKFSQKMMKSKFLMDKYLNS